MYLFEFPVQITLWVDRADTFIQLFYLHLFWLGAFTITTAFLQQTNLAHPTSSYTTVIEKRT